MNHSTMKYVGGIALVLIVVVWLAFPRGYGELSQEGYSFAIALYSACNQKDDDRLQVIADKVDAAHQFGGIADHEHDWLRDIIALGEEGSWKSAAEASQNMLRAQTKEV